MKLNVLRQPLTIMSTKVLSIEYAKSFLSVVLRSIDIDMPSLCSITNFTRSYDTYVEKGLEAQLIP